MYAVIKAGGRQYQVKQVITLHLTKLKASRARKLNSQMSSLSAEKRLKLAPLL